MYAYIETDSDSSKVTDIIRAESEKEMVRKLQRHFNKTFSEVGEETMRTKIARAHTLEEVGAAIDYTQGWGENDIKVGYLIECCSDDNFKQIW